jgi:hypothetical protein
MKNSIQLILITFLLLILSLPSFGQFEEMRVDTNQNVVISPNGLSIRSKPSLKSKKLGVVPFGKKVKIEDDKNYGWDTIGHYDFAWGESSNSNFPITGHWVKVKYKNIQGFMFGAYLHYESYNPNYESEMMKGLNKDFALFYPGVNCYVNINFQSNMKWYGIYKEDGIYHLKETTISFYKTYSEMTDEMTDFGISTSDNQSLLFIIGSKKPLKEKILEGVGWERFSHSFDRYKEKKFEEIKTYGIEIKKVDNQSGFSIKLNQGSQSQILNPKEMSISHALSIQWVGDLDDDGHLDFIFHYGDKIGQTILYLSSEAKDGKIVKPVAAYFSGYCC